MGSSDLLFICISAFISVFVLLSVLGLLMRLILAVFPEKNAGPDAAVLAAVSTVVQTLYLGTKITKVEEIK